MAWKKTGRYFRDIGYGYQWWSATVGDYYVDYAAGHGGQLIVLLDALDMVIVTTADPFYLVHTANRGRTRRPASISWAGSSIPCRRSSEACV